MTHMNDDDSKCYRKLARPENTLIAVLYYNKFRKIKKFPLQSLPCLKKEYHLRAPVFGMNSLLFGLHLLITRYAHYTYPRPSLQDLSESHSVQTLIYVSAKIM